ncbi:MAG: DNA repair protein RadC, partial [Chloroflexota bacterium]
MPLQPKKTPTISDMPAEERPRERLLKHGSDALSTAELLAILLRTGTESENVIRLAERILSHFGGLHGLAKTHPAQLMKIHGLGEAKVTQIAAAVEIGNRLAATMPAERTAIRSAKDAARLVMDMRYLSQEHVRLILLDSNSRVIAMPTVYIGTLNASVLRISEIFREAITRNSPAIILIHNHPDGSPDPSPEDIDLTRSVVNAGALLDIHVVDHLIIGDRDWRS